MPGVRRERVTLFALAALICIVYILTFREGTMWGDDFAQYIQHAANIVSGRPYAALPYGYDPIFLRPRVYPPGFPLLWTAPYALFGPALTPMKVITTLCFGTGLVLLGVLTRNMLTLRSRIALIVLIAANPLYWDFKDEVLTDWPFFALSMAALVMTQRLAEGTRREWITAIGAGVAMAAAISLRSHAVVLVPVMLAAVMLRRRQVTWPAVTAAALATLAAAVMLMSLPLLETYSEIADVVGRRIVGSLVFYAKCVSLLWDNGHSLPLRAALFGLTTLLALVGIAALRARSYIPALFVASYLFLLVGFGGWEGFRYLIPILPFYLVYVLAGIERVERAHRTAGATLLVSLLAAAALSYASMYSTMNLRGPLPTARPAIGELWQMLRTQTPEDAVVQFNRVRAGTLYSGRRGTQYLEGEPDDAIWRRLDGEGTTHLTFISPSDGAFTAGFLDRYSRCMTEIFANSEARVFELKSAPDRAALGCR